MKPVVVLNVVGLTTDAIDESTPNLRSLQARGGGAPMGGILPGVTLSAQATFLTGTLPSEHGAVGNGWFVREMGEPFFWRQPNALVEGPKVYERARERDASFTCAKLFWWWNMGAKVDWSITPRPFYPADGRKLLAVYGSPDNYAERLEAELGAFPFFDFWGPKAGLPSSEWIADAARMTLKDHSPTLTLVYLPHLDYDHQRFGPTADRSREAIVEVDRIVGELVAVADEKGAETIVLSEYGIEPVERAVHVNRVLREAGLLRVRRGPIGDLLDPTASRAFAVSDHQIAHVYCADEPARREAEQVLAACTGIEAVLGEEEQREAGLLHARSGDLVCVADEGAWFTYYHWLDDDEAPDYARTVDIHRKPGYDPCELFVDPALRFPALRVARRLAQKALGFRYLMDVIPLDASLVRGSHGRLPSSPGAGPVFLTSAGFDVTGGEPDGANGTVSPTSVADRILALLER